VFDPAGSTSRANRAHVGEVLGMARLVFAVLPAGLLVDVPSAAVEVLIGLDFLLGCKLVLDGPARAFSLES
jgi:hypothetical protein